MCQIANLTISCRNFRVGPNPIVYSLTLAIKQTNSTALISECIASNLFICQQYHLGNKIFYFETGETANLFQYYYTHHRLRDERIVELSLEALFFLLKLPYIVTFW